MELSFEPPTHLFVRRVADDTVVVGERSLHRSFLLTPVTLVEAWDVTSMETLEHGGIEPILALQPELVILGSGRRQRFPPAAVQAVFLKRGIGIETMDNAAAARTFNLLAGEDRHVVAAFMLDPGPENAQ